MGKKKYPQDGRKIFVRYANRKLYDTQTSAYVTVQAIAKLPAGSFKVIDQRTREDITNDVILSALTSHFEKNPETFATVKDEMVSRFLQN